MCAHSRRRHNIYASWWSPWLSWPKPEQSSQKETDCSRTQQAPISLWEEISYRHKCKYYHIERWNQSQQSVANEFCSMCIISKAAKSASQSNISLRTQVYHEEEKLTTKNRSEIWSDASVWEELETLERFVRRGLLEELQKRENRKVNGKNLCQSKVVVTSPLGEC